jgi:hypothetical protein
MLLMITCYEKILICEYLTLYFTLYSTRVLFLLNSISKHGNIPSSFFKCREEIRNALRLRFG